MAHVEVKAGTNAQEKSGTSRSTGKPYSMRTQEGWFHTGDGSIFKVTLMLNREQPAYQPGVYDIAPASWGVNSFGEVMLKRLVIQARAVAQPGSRAVAG